MAQSGFEPGALDTESGVSTIKPPRLPDFIKNKITSTVIDFKKEGRVTKSQKGVTPVQNNNQCPNRQIAFAYLF